MTVSILSSNTWQLLLGQEPRTGLYVKTSPSIVHGPLATAVASLQLRSGPAENRLLLPTASGAKQCQTHFQDFCGMRMSQGDPGSRKKNEANARRSRDVRYLDNRCEAKCGGARFNRGHRDSLMAGSDSSATPLVTLNTNENLKTQPGTCPRGGAQYTPAEEGNWTLQTSSRAFRHHLVLIQAWSANASLAASVERQPQDPKDGQSQINSRPADWEGSERVARAVVFKLGSKEPQGEELPEGRLGRTLSAFRNSGKIWRNRSVAEASGQVSISCMWEKHGWKPPGIRSYSKFALGVEARDELFLQDPTALRPKTGTATLRLPPAGQPPSHPAQVAYFDGMTQAGGPEKGQYPLALVPGGPAMWSEAATFGMELLSFLAQDVPLFKDPDHPFDVQRPWTGGGGQRREDRVWAV
ncbi:Breast Carcinoma-Amplified Sequence 1 [Manis pentadactyla]|nr:Breast Carcinoma-Amplified Sequence 1 [Manis pentadactyla]